MDSGTLREIRIDSCKNVYDYYAEAQKNKSDVSRSSIPIVRIQVNGAFVILYAGKKIPNEPGLGLSINGEIFRDKDVNYEQFDELSKTVTIFPSKQVLNLLCRGNPTVALVSDMKFLIKRTETYYERFGHLMALPKTDPHFDESEYSFPSGIRPSAEQKVAVKTILNSRLSYVWGAPGTGKTQFVLATAIMAYLRQGRRVCIIAPTNNSLEQVLRGLLKIIETEDPDGELVDMDHDILRLGMATSTFISEYPSVCERVGIEAEISSKTETMRILDDVIFEKQCDVLKSLFDEIISLYNEEYDKAGFFAKKKIMSQIRQYYKEIGEVVSSNDKFKHLMDGVDEYNYRPKAEELSKFLYERDRPANAIADYKDATYDDLIVLKLALAIEINELRSLEPEAKIDTAKIVATTPPTFMNRLSPGADGPGAEFKFDHIFIDEVGYCNVTQVLPFFAMGVPITMLGDHMQLPPVCEMDREEVLIEGIMEDTKMKHAFMWDQSALFAEQYLNDDIDTLTKAYTGDKDPVFKITKKCDLTLSHRFGNNLALILDECIYKNGIRGNAKIPLEILCVDAVCNSQSERENHAEVEAIGEFLDDYQLEEEAFAIITPYRAQVKALEGAYGNLKDNIMTVHKSQGREWDTVILSVADCRLQTRPDPLRFTSTKPGSTGIKVINTAGSRAKKRLVIVCDREFWTGKEGEMIGKMVKDLDESCILRYG